MLQIADNIHNNLLTFFSLLTVKARAPKEVVEQTASRTKSSFMHGFNTSTADMIQSGEPGEKTDSMHKIKFLHL